jgi:hypothetical protein
MVAALTVVVVAAVRLRSVVASVHVSAVVSVLARMQLLPVVSVAVSVAVEAVPVGVVVVVLVLALANHIQ